MSSIMNDDQSQKNSDFAITNFSLDFNRVFSFLKGKQALMIYEQAI